MARPETSASPFNQANPSEFANAVTHGLRTPLAALRASMESWTRPIETDGATTSPDARVDHVLDEVARLARNVQALAEWADQAELLPLPCSAEEIARSTVRARASESHRIALICAESSELLHVDGPILTSCLIRLLDNALEAGTGTILFRTATTERGWVFRFIEAGMGFHRPLDELERPFVTDKSGALGIGLPLARREIERLGGQLHLKRTRLGYTHVSVTIPFVCEVAA